MGLDHSLRPLIIQPGIQRDITRFSSKGWIDGQWVRFYGETFQPRKIGGYKQATTGTADIVRSIFPVARFDINDPYNPNNINAFDLYMGNKSGIRFMSFYENTVVGTFVNRTPTEYIDQPEALRELSSWTFDQMTVLTDLGELQSIIVGHVAPNATNIASTEPGKVYAGLINSTDPLTDITPTEPKASAGGIVYIAPNLFLYGENGVVQWCAANSPQDWPAENYAVVGSTKVVASTPIKGGGLFWTLRELVRATQDGGDKYTFDVVETDISIMSQKCVVKFDQMYYWIGLDQFFYYNGVVNRIYNTYNGNYFFDGLNYNAREKVFGMAIPRYQEIWWFYPRGSATECTHVIAYNIKGDFWYDLELPRAAGVEPSYFQYPIMTDSQSSVVTSPITDVPVGFPIWIHEYGTDREIGGNKYAIPAYITTPYMSLFEQDYQTDLQMRSRRFEPDFELQGNLDITVSSYSYPLSDPQNVITYNYREGQGRVDMHSMGRLVTFTFTSNQAGGFFQMGKPLIDITTGDVRQGL